MLSKNSLLHSPPLPISERQVILLDGIRYSADMAAIALDRLWKQLCVIDSLDEGSHYQHIVPVYPAHISIPSNESSKSTFWHIIPS